jgi:hypothetical protein
MPNVYLDIETIPGPHPPDLEAMKAKAPSNYKKPEAIQKWAEENQEAEHRKQALDSMQGQILCIGVAIDDDEPQVCYDKERLQLVWLEENILDHLQGNIVWIGHNIRSFDLQWLWRKAVKYNLPGLCDYIPRYRYAKNVIDTMEVWAGPDYRAMCSLDSIARFLGIPGKDGVDGSMVYDLWQAGEHEKIREYCAGDVRMVREVYKRLPKIQ